jgi:hypothetical protein
MSDSPISNLVVNVVESIEVSFRLTHKKQKRRRADSP